jgi:hypothetical protein
MDIASTFQMVAGWLTSHVDSISTLPLFFIGDVGGAFGKDQPSAPPAPDYTGAAVATAAGNLDAARAAATANRVNQITPQGRLQYQITGQDPHGNDIWTATQTYSPDQQAIYQGQTDLSKGLLNTAQTGLNYVGRQLGNGGALDYSKISDMPIQGQSVQDAVMSRLQPTIEHNRASLDQQLANQGITPGSEAWNYAKKQQGQQENDQYTQAALQGINTGLTARQQGIQEQYTSQDRPLNIINALRTGSQVSTPQFVNVPQQQTVPGPNYLGAAQAQYAGDLSNYNTQVASNNNMMGGLFNIGATVAGASGTPWWL